MSDANTQGLEFGVALDPGADDPERAVRLAIVADEAGLDLVGVQDLPYAPHFLDTWTLLAVLAARTRRVRLYPGVASLPLRPPAILAKAAATLDLLSGGRVELGLGAGGSWDGIAALGGPVRRSGEAVVALEEAIRVIHLLWSGDGPVRFEGVHYRLEDAQPGPRPAHPISIWLGALGPRMLDLTGRLADGWIVSTPFTPPGQLPAMRARIDAAALAAGRDPGAIRRAYNVVGTIRPRGSRVARPLDGPAEHWVEELTRYTLEEGIDTFILAPQEDPERQLRLFAEEVVPAVRAAVRRPTVTPERSLPVT
ncbi:MAG: LLM class flavin-dependent oxidoreductase [Chloroflexota bacterium]|nr:LLM class flavin-dependent oxidoreductase [Chloroflexota bacterium]